MKTLANDKGMTLVEILISLAIFGIILSSMYSVYISMNKTSVEELGVVDTQQNLRVAIELIGHDIKMAGAIIPATSTPVPAATANSITVQTASSFYTYATLSEDIEIAAGTIATGTTEFKISMPTMVDFFSGGDTVRIIRPQSGEQPLNLDLTVSAVNRAMPSITLNGLATASAVQYKAGDLLVRVSSGAPDPSSVVWDITGTNLRRNRDGGGAEIVAENITALGFAYILENGTEETAPTAADLDDIKAVRVEITGTADDQLDGQIRQRSLSSIYYLRNRLL